MTDIDAIRLVEMQNIDLKSYKAHLADCVVLTHDGKLLMQQRPLDWCRWAGVLNLFGGHVEAGESVLQGLIRELHEELGAVVDPVDVIPIGALTEGFTDHTELVHIHFWYDRRNTITGCYEAEAVPYVNAAEALGHPKIMDYARWALLECRQRGLLS